MGYFLDEPGRQELLHLLANGPALLLVESVQALLHWYGAGPDIQGVLGDGSRCSVTVHAARQLLTIARQLITVVGP